MRNPPNRPMRNALACKIVIAMVSGAAAQVPVTDAARLPVNLEIKANTQNSAEAKKPVVTTTNGTACNFRRAGSNGQATTWVSQSPCSGPSMTMPGCFSISVQ